MLIKGFTIKNFRGIKEMTVDELHPRVNLFVGVNGAGKSSVLDAISNVFSWFVARMQSPSGRGRDIPQDDIRIGAKEGCVISLNMGNAGQWSLYRSRERKKDGRSDLSSMNSVIKDYWQRGYDNPESPVPVIVHYRVERSVTDIPLKIRKKQITSTYDAYQNALHSTASFRDFFSWFREQEDLENERIRKERDYRDSGLEAIRKAMSMVFPDYSDLRVNRKPQSLLITKNGESLKLSQLSDGEKCYIALISDLVRRLYIANPGKDPLSGEGIVLIDEVDLHLHPQWQLDIVSRLKTVFANCQFILTTHSPIVASDAPGKVYELIGGDAYETKVFGKKSEDILSSTFGVSNPRNKSVQNDIELAYKAIYGGDQELFEQLLHSLTETLGASDLDVARLRLEYRRRHL